MSPQAYIEYVRLSRAAQMLEMSSWPIGRIAEEVGIPNPFYFSTRFRQRFGIPPSAYRERHSPSGPTATVI
jgi:AraC family transcriptional regulator of arabinose operon